MRHYYNEIDPKAAAWLRELITAGEIPDGDVDERDIRDIRPIDLESYTQCHFFAGIGGWPLALRIAGVPPTRRLWTGSCPCQPFSAAGRRGGTDDERHLWPHWFHLIEVCRPPSIFGEQVASKDGLGWLDLVQADLEGTDYAVGAADLCAAGIGAPHIRQRLFFGAYDLRSAADGLQHASGDGRQERRTEPSGRGATGRCGTGKLGDSFGAGLEGHGGNGDDPRGWSIEGGSTAAASTACDMADADICGRAAGERNGTSAGQGVSTPADSESGELADACCERRQQNAGSAPRNEETYGGARRDWREPDSDHQFASHGENSRPGPTNGFWRDADWLRCRDDKWRPVEPGTFPLAHGVSDRVGLLRGYGNAIVPQVAATFIQAFEDARGT